MTTGFVLHLESATQYERLERVTRFRGEDASGSFTLLARHARFITVLGFGMARFRTADGSWEYVAVPGGVVYFSDNELHLSTRRYLRDSDYTRVRQALQREFLAEEELLQEIKRSLRRMEEEMHKRLLELHRRSHGP